jgi:tRNA(Arg) A34 adenosine deaminase TadA
MDDTDRRHLTRCVELAEAALAAGDDPFGSILVAADGTVLREDQHRAGKGDETLHPEFELARWAANNMTPAERAGATVYTSGEHCPMCSAAHAWVGLGRIVYAVSSAQLVEWRKSFGASASPVAVLPIAAIATGIKVEGP